MITQRLGNTVVHSNFSGWHAIAPQTVAERRIDVFTANVMRQTIPIVERSVFRIHTATLLPGMERPIFSVSDSRPLFPGTHAVIKSYNMWFDAGNKPVSVLRCVYSNDTPQLIPKERIESSLADYQNGLGSLQDITIKQLKINAVWAKGFIGCDIVCDGRTAAEVGLPQGMNVNHIKGIDMWEALRSDCPKVGTHANMYFLYSRSPFTP